jgi:hypothetical protein
MKAPFLVLLTCGISLTTLVLAVDRAIAQYPITWNVSAANLRSQSDRNISFTCAPTGRAYTIWGTDVYADDSSVCTAAVHAGLITLKDGGTVTIGIRPGQDSYNGTTQNNIRSLNYRKWKGSFIFVK